MTDAEKKPVTLTVEMAQRMHAVGKDMPESSKDEVRQRYEAMAVEGRAVMSERLARYVESVARLCIEKKHVGATPSAAGGGSGTPCPQCRKQIRYMRSALKVVAPSPND